MKKGKAKKIPSSKAELRKWLKKAIGTHLYVLKDESGNFWFNCCENIPYFALWAMPLADIVKSKRGKKR